MTEPTPELLAACAHHIPTVKADAHEAWLVCSCGMQSYRSGQTWSEWWVNHMASFVQEREQAARLDERERCYQVARGPEDRFDKLGARQLYWKGRSDAATDIRMPAEPKEPRDAP